MHFLRELLALLAVASLGIFFGAMLTEGLVLVPYWRSLPAEAFYSWYGANDKRLLGFFGPLTWLAALSALAGAGISVWTDDVAHDQVVGAVVAVFGGQPRHRACFFEDDLVRVQQTGDLHGRFLAAFGRSGAFRHVEPQDRGLTSELSGFPTGQALAIEPAVDGI